jgi:HD-GYP domain-containing protein (c-di-GMP phosphodiesterase class II)
MIHDIGKIYIPAEILSRPGKLSYQEMELIKTHPQVGYDIIKSIQFPWPVGRMVLEHHERMDGSGYPNGLMGHQLLIESRILCVADVVEAIHSHRPYRAGLGMEIALMELQTGRGIIYDEDACHAITSLIENGEFIFSE